MKGLFLFLLSLFCAAGAALATVHLAKLPGTETSIVAGSAVIAWAASYIFMDPDGAVRRRIPLFSIVAGCHVILIFYMTILPGFGTPVSFWFSATIIMLCGIALGDEEKNARRANAPSKYPGTFFEALEAGITRGGRAA